MNCAQNMPNRSQASRTVIDRFDSTASAKNDCAAVRNSSSRCRVSIGRPCRLALEIANTIGSVPTSSVHWFTFELTSVPSPAFVFSRHAYRPATSSSGASLASGASHCTRRNSLIPTASPLATSDSAKCSAQSRMTAAAAANRTTIARAPGAR